MYLIILDEYANSNVLREFYGFDNSAFEDSLHAMGFTIPDSVRSNYDMTLMSLTSLLNVGHVAGLEADLGARATSRTVPYYLLEHNRVVQFLRSQGYSLVLAPGSWRGANGLSRYADLLLPPPGGLDVALELDRTDLRRAVWDETMLRVLFPPGDQTARNILRTFEALKEVPSRTGPTFTIAHFMAPHRPYRFDATCRPLARPRNLKDRAIPIARQGYLDQLQCVNRLLLDLAGALLRRSDTPPIILHQGDHGTRTIPFSAASESLMVAYAREAFGAFGAYYLPEGGSRSFTGTITLVNVFANVLNHYFGTTLPPQANRSYITHAPRLYDFIPVDSIG